MLTTKEIAVLELKQKGFTQVEIARKLKISQPAVSNFYNNAIKKIKDAKAVLKTSRKMGVHLNE